MLGRLLEISVDCGEVLESLEFWRGLGFSLLPTSDTWKHRYGVASDGHLYLGLHDFRFPSPSLTFVTPRLRETVEQLEQEGIHFEFAKLSPDEFNEAGFFDPTGQIVTLLEARTFSPPSPGETGQSLLGHFRAVRRRSTAPADARDFWGRLGALEYGEDEIAGDGFNLQFRPDSAAVELVFESPTPADRAGRLVQAGFRIRPEGEDQILEAPDGLRVRMVPEESTAGPETLPELESED